MSRILEIELAGKPVLRGIHHYWNVMMDLDKRGPFTTGDVYRQTNDQDKTSVQRYVRSLVKCGYLGQLGTREGAAPMRSPIPLYKVLKRSQLPPPVSPAGKLITKGRAPQCMWNILRGVQARTGITIRDLALLAATPDLAVSLATAKDYIAALQSAGMLTVRGKQGNENIYVLKREANTGPIAPVVMRFRAVYDPNSHNIVNPIATAEEDSR